MDLGFHYTTLPFLSYFVGGDGGGHGPSNPLIYIISYHINLDTFPECAAFQWSVLFSIILIC